MTSTSQPAMSAPSCEAGIHPGSATYEGRARGGTRPARLLRRSDPENLLAWTGGGARGSRDRAALVLLWRAGLRARELCLARVEDLDRDVLRVEHPKRGGGARGAPRRRVGLDPRTKAFLDDWLQHRTAATGLREGEGPLLATSTGRALCPSHLRRLVRRLGVRSGLGRVHPHALRHRFAADLYEERVGIREIQLLLGHKDLSVTAAYLTSIGAEEAAEVNRRRNW